MKKIILIALLAASSASRSFAMLESIGIFRKNQQEIALFGLETFQGLKDETKLVLDAVEKWASIINAPVCLFFDGPQRLAALAAEAEKALKFGLEAGPTILLTLKAVRNNFRYKNMGFFYCTANQEFENQLVLFGNLMPDFFDSAAKKSNVAMSRDDFDRTLKNQASRKKALEKGGFFDAFEDRAKTVFASYLAQTQNKPYTIAQYLAHYDDIISTLRKVILSDSCLPAMKRVLEKQLAASDHCRTKLTDFFNLYSKSPDDSLLVSQINAYRSKVFYTETYHAIKSAVMPAITLIKNLHALMMLKEALQTHPRIFSFCGQNVALEFHEQLKDLGFNSQRFGMLVNAANTTKMVARRVSPDDLAKILNSLFAQEAQTFPR